MRAAGQTAMARFLKYPPAAMALPINPSSGAGDSRALSILAKTIYRELRSSGYAEKDVLALAGELLGMVTTEVQERRAPDSAVQPRVRD